MLDIVVYENKKNFIFKNIDVEYGVHFNIFSFNGYNNGLENIIKGQGRKKIYVLSDEVDGVSGLELAVKIREYDWESIIILLVKLDRYVSDVLGKKLMFLDIIVRDNSYCDRLVNDIKLAISIIVKNNVFSYRYNNVVYRIPYEQICYIEKESMIKRCIIHTINGDYYITENICDILSHLGNNFCRTHQSCIVNLNNIVKIDLSSNEIIFKDGNRTNMLTVKMKKVIKEYIGIS